MKSKFNRLIFSILIVNIFVSTTAYSKFDVKIIYFKPTDAGDIDVGKHDAMLKDIQQHYQSEMTRHGYKDYTFPLELDASGKLIIHVVNAKNNSIHYDRDTASKMYDELIKPELPFEFNNDRSIESRDNVHLIILGGVKAEPWGGKVGMGHTWLQGRWGGNALVLMDTIRTWRNHYLGLIAHEIGHAFALDPGHNNIRESLNGRVIAFGQTTEEWGDRMNLLKFEADLLKSRPIFRRIQLEDAQAEPKNEVQNKNPNLVEEQLAQEDKEPISIKPKFKLTTMWAKMKTERR